MELWIRSQDRKNLVRVNALYMDTPYDFGEEGFGIYCDKRDNYISNSLLKIGTYATIERAKEVLDEIEELDTSKKNIIVSKHFGNLIKITYEMPEE